MKTKLFWVCRMIKFYNLHFTDVQWRHHEWPRRYHVCVYSVDTLSKSRVTVVTESVTFPAISGKAVASGGIYTAPLLYKRKKKLGDWG
jgi:hypothetical protein